MGKRDRKGRELLLQALLHEGKPLRLVVASGKGGTGKTTVAVNLARTWGGPVQLLDCDVEAPNTRLFLGGTVLDSQVVTVPVPEVNEALCIGCGECSRFCEYSALACVAGKAMVFVRMCHSCGGCSLVCPAEAISEVENRIGTIVTSCSGNITLLEGILDVGGAMAPPLIRRLKSQMQSGVPAILDSPPGTSCPVVTTMKGADFVILVTEPTPFGLHDLTLAVATTRELGLPFGVVVNRLGTGDDRVHSYCGRENIQVLLEIPDDRRIAEAYSRGELMVDALPEYAGLFAGLRRELEERR
ncbi:MAG: ATP-binding protein [Candidatus Fermentibacteraceae bacterium]